MANPDLKNLNNVYGIGEGFVNIPTTPTGILVNAGSSGFVSAGNAANMVATRARTTTTERRRSEIVMNVNVA